MFNTKVGVEENTNMKNVSLGLCEPELEGMCRMDSEDRKHVHGGVFSVLAVEGMRKTLNS